MIPSQAIQAKSNNAAAAKDTNQEPLLSLAEQLPEVSSWVPQALMPAWELIISNPWLGPLIIATLFYFLALLVRGTLFLVLHRLANLTNSGTDDLILDQLKRPVFTTVFCFGLMLAVQVAQLPMGTVTLNNILFSLIVISWMRALFNIAGLALEALGRQGKFNLIEARTVPMFDITAKLLIILFGSYALLMVWGVNPVGWLASAGIVGIAVGFAAKDTLANLFSGFFIVADAPYKIGDYINLDTGERGKVSAIGLRSTRLLTRDDVEITIPNGVIANAKIVNESGGHAQAMRIRVAVGAAYGSNPEQVCAILQAIGDKHPKTMNHPEPRVRMRAFGASSLDFELLCWIDHPQDRGLITHELLMQIYRDFEDAGIEIPYSKHDVYIKEMPKAPSTET